jgi:replicative DNA helicase
MNSEYALIRLILKDPHWTVSLNRRGLRAKHFKNEIYGKAYKLIHNTHVNFQSIPTDDEFKSIGLKLDNEPVQQTVDHCFNYIMENYRKRLTEQAIRSAAEALTHEGTEQALEIMKKANAYMPEIDKIERSKYITDYSEQFWENYEFRKQFKGQIVGVPSGFEIIDNLTMGFRKQWLITISGRNAQFKTWVLLFWAMTAWKAGKNVAIFSCEMSIDELALRIHSLASKVPPSRVQHATLTLDEEMALQNHLKSCHEPPYGKLIINDYPGSITAIKAEIDEINKTTPIDILFIDSAYRMVGDGDNEVSRQASIARNSKNLAKDLDIPVVCSVQLNREFAKANANEKTKGRTISGAHYVHGTDAWEQDSDMVFAINRPEDYEEYNYSDFICTKFRHGPEESYILEINLLVPKIQQVDAEAAKARIKGDPPPQTQKADTRFDQARMVMEQMQKLNQLQKQFEDNPNLTLNINPEEKEDEDGV